jgi:fumarate hydratase class II
MSVKVNPTQSEALAMIVVQVTANDVAVGFGGAGSYLEMRMINAIELIKKTNPRTKLIQVTATELLLSSLKSGSR